MVARFCPFRGFTLIEIVTTLVLLAILALIGLPILSNSLRAYDATEASLAVLTRLRYATERLAREIREVRRDPAVPTDYDIAVMSSASLRFTKADGVEVTLTGSPPTVTLEYSAPAVAPAPVLTDRATGLQLKYFKADGKTEATSKSDVAFVEIGLTLAEGAAAYPQRTRVGLRNKL